MEIPYSMKNPIILISILFFFISLNGMAQDKLSEDAENTTEKNTGISLRNEALNVFLDCRWCDRNYIKKTIPFVNYVNNKDEADVHILVSRRITGGGGGEYTINFIGMGDYAGIDDELVFFSNVEETRDETRNGRSGMIGMGLMRYVARTPLSANINISYENDESSEKELVSNVEDDPWDSWMFRIRGTGEFSKDENYQNRRINGSLSADRVTPDWKIEFDAAYSYNETIYTSDLERNYRRNWSLRGLLVKSLGPNWALGGRASISSDTRPNYELTSSFGPAIEYNIFPYEESNEKQFRFQYGIGMVRNNYIDTTIYFKTEETVVRQYLAISLGFTQPWGSGYFSITGANYLHDFALNNLSIRGSINYRIYKGLSINIQPRASIIHDQINLRKGEASAQDVLTRQHDLQTEYSYGLELGITYSFGSIYNNVVNPRFGNTGGGRR